MLLDHVPQRYQVQRMQHLILPLSLALHDCILQHSRVGELQCKIAVTPSAALPVQILSYKLAFTR